MYSIHRAQSIRRPQPYLGLVALIGVLTIVPGMAANTAFTYQGRVTSSGTNFSGSGLFKFALVTSQNGSSQATATANLTGSFVTSCTIVDSGSGYTSAPGVSFSGGGGSGAAAMAVVNGGQVTDIIVINAGSGYSSAPTVTIAPPPDSLVFTTYWSNDGTSVNGSEPAAAVSVGVNNGLFTVVLGDTGLPNMMAIDDSLFAQPDLQLRIWFNNGVDGFAALSPVQDLTPAPYAAYARNAGSLPGGLSASALTSIGNTNGGGGNFFVGHAGNAAMSGGQNTALGDFALLQNKTGSGNTAAGYGALASNTNGSFNTAGGSYALNANTSGSGNTANGYAALYLNKSGNNNTAVGRSAMFYNTNGNANAAFGYSALQLNFNGNNNTALGESALSFLTTGSGNIAIGQGAGTAITTGNNNIDIGNVGFGNESDTIRIGTTQTKAVMLGISGNTIASSAGVVCVNSQGLLGTGSASSAALGADLHLEGGAAYHHIRLSGGNSQGFMYGSFPAFGDGIHLGYNYYADAGGAGHVIVSGGGTSRLSVGYGGMEMWVGGVNTAPNLLKLAITTSSVTVNGTFNNNSDRDAKQEVTPVSSAEVLDKVLRLPISEWSYKTETGTRHVGPMAQDFYSVFNLGTDDRHIAPIDEGGVALAAIQGLHEKLVEKNGEIAELKQRLERLEQLIDRTNRHDHEKP